jgi:hypothetical protein
MRDEVTPDEVAALAVLARRGRIVAILVPDGVRDEDVGRLTLEINARLDELALAVRIPKHDGARRAWHDMDADHVETFEDCASAICRGVMPLPFRG